MKKTLLLALLVLFFVNSKPVLAADPDCDPGDVYLQNSNTPAPIAGASSQIGASQTDCNSVSATAPTIPGYTITGYKYCSPTIAFGASSPISASCWPKMTDTNGNPVTAISKKTLQVPATSVLKICGTNGSCSLSPVGSCVDSAGRQCGVLPNCSSLNDGFTFDGASNQCVLTLTPSTIVSSTGVHICAPGDSCDTALGMLSTDPINFFAQLFRIIIGLSGGVMVLVGILAGYGVMTSAGDPKKLEESREKFVSFIAGTAMIIFSLVILQSVGVDILGIKAFQNAMYHIQAVQPILQNDHSPR